MKKRWLVVLLAVTLTLLLVFPAGSLAAANEAQGGVLLEGEETAEVTPTPEPEPAPATPVPTEAPLPIGLSANSMSLMLYEYGRLSSTNYSYNQLTFASTNNSIAYCINGNVTTTGIGTATITAQVKGTNIRESCVVTVRQNRAERVLLWCTTTTVSVGKTFGVDCYVYPDEATRNRLVTYSWSSSNASILRIKDEIANSASIQGVGEGTATITVTVDGISDSKTVTVTGTAPSSNVTPTPTLSPTTIPTMQTSLPSTATIVPDTTPTAIYNATPIPSATPRPPSSAAAATPTPSLTKALDESGIPNPTRVPVELEATDWAGAEQAAGGLEAGNLGSIEAPDDGLVPSSLLETLQQNQSALEIDCGGYFCIIDGAALTGIPEGLETIDIGMTMEKDSALSAAWGCNAYELRFNYHGELPGTFTFRVKAQGSRPGDTIYLYYFDDIAGKFEGVHTAVVDDQGYVSLNITHCSSYYITNAIIEGADNNFTVPAETAAAQTGFAAFVHNNKVVFWLTLYFLGVGVVVLLAVFIRRGIKRGRKPEAKREDPVNHTYMK